MPGTGRRVPGTVRPREAPFATDGTGLYFGTQQLESHPEIECGSVTLAWSKARLRARLFNEVNVPGLGEHRYVVDHGDTVTEALGDALARVGKTCYVSGAAREDLDPDRLY